MRTLAFIATATLAASSVAAQTPQAIAVDPPRDSAHPARMEVLHIPSGGVRINGVAYLASGAGPHPTFVLLHGLPGNEKNLDLAQAVRRAGWNAITFNYRGSWGSPGSFRFGNNLQDADAVLRFLAKPANRALPVAESRLSNKLCGRIPGRIPAMAHPAEIGRKRQQDDDRFAKRAGQMRNRRIDRNDDIKQRDHRCGVGKIA